MFDRLTNDWQGRTVIIIAGGPSLKMFNFMNIKPMRNRGAIVVAINDAIKRCRWADVVISIDRVWLGRRHRELARFKGEKIAVCDSSRSIFRNGIRYIVRDSAPRLSDDMGVICTGENSGFAALGMSLMRGAGLTMLLGLDLNGPGHFHAGYEWNCPHGVDDYPRWAGYFSALAEAARERGQRVVNCNPDSAVRCFPFGAIEGGELKMMETAE